MTIRLRYLCVCILALACSVLGHGRDAVFSETLQQVLPKAGYVFLGRVTEVRYLPPRNSTELGTVRVTFNVEQGIRGTKTGTTFSIREWSGLWNSGERYRNGERLVLFLYPPSRVGLTSTVAGPNGRFRVDRSGYVILPGPISPIAAPGRPSARTHVPVREFTRAIRRAAVVERER
jgi:hypothetical protein